MNIFFWINYYFKCLTNIIYSYINYIQIENINVKDNKHKIQKINKYLYLIKLKGSYYEMGIQYGKMMKKILQNDVSILKKFLNENNDIYYNKIPKIYRKNNLLDSLLNYYICIELYLNKDVIDFNQGLCESSEISLNDFNCINLFPDLMNHHCIIMSKILNNNKLNIRTFDFDSPQLTHSLIVFHPINKIPYLSLNTSIFSGMVTGISKNNIFFGESYHDDVIGELSYKGMPFHHISHKILSEHENMNNIEQNLIHLNRKSNLQLLFSDNNKSIMFLSSVDTLIKHKECNLVFSVSDHEKDRFENNLKYLDCIENVIQHFIPKTKSGELHSFISYDNKIYVSVTSDVLQSYNNTFHEFDLNHLFEIF